jgi:hypothetical protein
MKEEQLREDQRREALARKDEPPHAEETSPPPPPPPAPRVEEPAPPAIDSKALLESDGLVMIETDRAKAPDIQVEEAPQQLGRPRRERPKATPQDEELQQVETRK